MPYLEPLVHHLAQHPGAGAVAAVGLRHKIEQLTELVVPVRTCNKKRRLTASSLACLLLDHGLFVPMPRCVRYTQRCCSKLQGYTGVRGPSSRVMLFLAVFCDIFLLAKRPAAGPMCASSLARGREIVLHRSENTVLIRYYKSLSFRWSDIRPV